MRGELPTSPSARFVRSLPAGENYSFNIILLTYMAVKLFFRLLSDSLGDRPRSMTLRYPDGKVSSWENCKDDGDATSSWSSQSGVALVFS